MNADYSWRTRKLRNFTAKLLRHLVKIINPTRANKTQAAFELEFKLFRQNPNKIAYMIEVKRLKGYYQVYKNSKTILQGTQDGPDETTILNALIEIGYQSDDESLIGEEEEDEEDD